MTESLESHYFWFMTGKSSWVHSRTQGFIPIVVDGTVYHGYCKNCFCPAVDEEWALGRHLLLILLICFCGSVIMNWHYVFELWWQMLVSNFNLLPLLFYWTWFVITLSHTLMKELYLWSLCNVWHVGWIMYNLGYMLIVNRDPSWYSMDYRVYMGLGMTVRPLVGYHCTCALINWSVLL